jgi:hypothetical protein
MEPFLVLSLFYWIFWSFPSFGFFVATSYTRSISPTAWRHLLQKIQNVQEGGCRSVSRRRGTQSRQKFTKGTVYSNLTGSYRLEVLSMSSLWKPWSFEKESVCKKRIQEPLWALCVLSQAWCSPWCKVFILNQIKYNYLFTLLNNILKVKTRN